MDEHIRLALRSNDLRAVTLLLRLGRRDEALDLLEARTDDEGQRLLGEVLGAIPKDERWSQVARLQRLGRRGLELADRLWQRWFLSGYSWAPSWHGGHYDLTLTLGDARGVGAALVVLWNDPDIFGCFDEIGYEPIHLDRVVPSPSEHHYGIARLPNGRTTPCGTICWEQTINLYLPCEALMDAYRFAHVVPAEVDEWLAQIGRRVFAAVPFRFGIVGFETDHPGEPTEVPEDHCDGWLWPRDGHLEWHPVTRS